MRPAPSGVLQGFTLIGAPIALPSADGAGPIYIGDFNNDGNTDFIVNGQTDNTATVYFGSGNGSFTPQAPLSFDHHVHSLLMHDMNGDGIQDMVVEGDKGVIEIFPGTGTTANPFSTPSIGGTPAGVDGFYRQRRPPRYYRSHHPQHPHHHANWAERARRKRQP